LRSWPRKPWCSGAVGMMGISWGGFNSLQVAALRPPALARSGGGQIRQRDTRGAANRAHCR